VRERILRYISCSSAGACVVGLLISGISALIQTNFWAVLLYTFLTIVVVFRSFSPDSYNSKAFFLLPQFLDQGFMDTSAQG